MKKLTINQMNAVLGTGDVNWVQVGRDVVTDGAGVAGGAFGLGLGGPIGAGFGAVAASAGAGVIYDAAGNTTTSSTATSNSSSGS
ncbi:colicin V family bacteriocin [Rouxiella sp. Mn2063]|uniref:colicin V family bacteriocin n=1 Tax=Rouxiella sp. Mn2063 TaxID=3395262 RepID=UPI003BCF4837